MNYICKLGCVVQYTRGFVRGVGLAGMFQEVWAVGPTCSQDTSQANCAHFGVWGPTEEALSWHLLTSMQSGVPRSERWSPFLTSPSTSGSSGPGLGSPSSQAGTVLMALLPACISLPPPNKTFLPLLPRVVEKPDCIISGAYSIFVSPQAASLAPGTWHMERTW